MPSGPAPTGTASRPGTRPRSGGSRSRRRCWSPTPTPPVTATLSGLRPTATGSPVALFVRHRAASPSPRRHWPPTRCCRLTVMPSGPLPAGMVATTLGLEGASDEDGPRRTTRRRRLRRRPRPPRAPPPPRRRRAPRPPRSAAPGSGALGRGERAGAGGRRGGRPRRRDGRRRGGGRRRQLRGLRRGRTGGQAASPAATDRCLRAPRARLGPGRPRRDSAGRPAWPSARSITASRPAGVPGAVSTALGAGREGGRTSWPPRCPGRTAAGR